MMSAARAPNYHTKELLIATILEAIFRNIEKKPFKRDGKSLSMKNLIPRFCKQYLSPEWFDVCDNMLDLHKELRDRNAHPDWLFEQDGSLSEEETTKSFNDMILLSRFYGYLILAFSGEKNIKPKFPSRTDEI